MVSLTKFLSVLLVPSILGLAIVMSPSTAAAQYGSQVIQPGSGCVSCGVSQPVQRTLAAPVAYPQPVYHQPQPVYHQQRMYQPQPVYHQQRMYPQPVYHQQRMYPQPVYQQRMGCQSCRVPA